MSNEIFLMSLQFQTKFPGGNARIIEYREDNDGLLRFCPDPHGGGSALWFHFRINVKDPAQANDRSLTIQLENVDFCNGLHECPSFRPVSRAEGRDWTHLRLSRLVIQPDGRQNLLWEIAYPTTSMEIACTFPYGRAELQQLVSRHGGSSWSESDIGLTGSGRSVVRIFNQPGSPDQCLPGVYILARQHAGEPTASWFMDGLLSELERSARRPALIWAVPFCDADGFHRGLYGRDIDRSYSVAWNEPSERTECSAVQHDIRRWRARCSLPLLINLEATPRFSINTFRIIPAEVSSIDRGHQAWANVLMQSLSRSFPCEVAHQQQPKSTKGSSILDWASSTDLPALTVQVPWWLSGDKPMTRKIWRDAGKAAAGAIAQRWQQMAPR